MHCSLSCTSDDVVCVFMAHKQHTPTPPPFESGFLMLMYFCSVLATTITTTTTTTTTTEATSLWTEWGEWSACDSSCSCGKKIRLRHCANAPSTDSCHGKAIETAPCSSESTNQHTTGVQNVNFVCKQFFQINTLQVSKM